MLGTATEHRAAGNLRDSKSSCVLPERWHMLAIETTPCLFREHSVPIGAGATDEQPEAAAG